MKRLALLLTLIFVAAGPQLLVEISYSENGQARITDYDRQSGEDPTRMSGQWTLELRDADGVVVEQTRYSPLIVLPDASEDYISEVYVPIRASGAARTIAVVDPDGETVSAYEIADVCGDNRCASSESAATCPQDCNAAAAQARENQEVVAPINEPEPTRGAGFWLGISAAALLIIVLVLVLIHLNRKKENPIQGEYRQY